MSGWVQLQPNIRLKALGLGYNPKQFQRDWDHFLKNCPPFSFVQQLFWLDWCIWNHYFPDVEFPFLGVIVLPDGVRPIPGLGSTATTDAVRANAGSTGPASVPQTDGAANDNDEDDDLRKTFGSDSGAPPVQKADVTGYAVKKEENEKDATKPPLHNDTAPNAKDGAGNERLESKFDKKSKKKSDVSQADLLPLEAKSKVGSSTDKPEEGQKFQSRHELPAQSANNVSAAPQSGTLGRAAAKRAKQINGREKQRQFWGDLSAKHLPAEEKKSPEADSDAPKCQDDNEDNEGPPPNVTAQNSGLEKNNLNKDPKESKHTVSKTPKATKHNEEPSKIKPPLERSDSGVHVPGMNEDVKSSAEAKNEPVIGEENEPSEVSNSLDTNVKSPAQQRFEQNARRYLRAVKDHEEKIATMPSGPSPRPALVKLFKTHHKNIGNMINRMKSIAKNDAVYYRKMVNDMGLDESDAKTLSSVVDAGGDWTPGLDPNRESIETSDDLQPPLPGPEHNDKATDSILFKQSETSNSPGTDTGLVDRERFERVARNIFLNMDRCHVKSARAQQLRPAGPYFIPNRDYHYRKNLNLSKELRDIAPDRDDYMEMVNSVCVNASQALHLISMRALCMPDENIRDTSAVTSWEEVFESLRKSQPVRELNDKPGDPQSSSKSEEQPAGDYNAESGSVELPPKVNEQQLPGNDSKPADPELATKSKEQPAPEHNDKAASKNSATKFNEQVVREHESALTSSKLPMNVNEDHEPTVPESSKIAGDDHTEVAAPQQSVRAEGKLLLGLRYSGPQLLDLRLPTEELERQIGMSQNDGAERDNQLVKGKELTIESDVMRPYLLDGNNHAAKEGTSVSTTPEKKKHTWSRSSFIFSTIGEN